MLWTTGYIVDNMSHVLWMTVHTYVVEHMLWMTDQTYVVDHMLCTRNIGLAL